MGGGASAARGQFFVAASSASLGTSFAATHRTSSKMPPFPTKSVGTHKTRKGGATWTQQAAPLRLDGVAAAAYHPPN